MKCVQTTFQVEGISIVFILSENIVEIVVGVKFVCLQRSLVVLCVVYVRQDQVMTYI